MKAAEKVNIAMIGRGFMGKAHALAQAAMPMFFWPAPAIPVRKVMVDVTDELASEAQKRLGYEEASSKFFDALVNGKQPSPNFRDGYVINCIAGAIEPSSAKQAWVKVNR
jgi:predicted dehydrogenase